MSNQIDESLAILEEIVSNILNIDNLKLKLEQTAQDIDGWDSLVHAQILYACESRFKIRFSLAEIGKLKTIGDLIDLIIENKV